MTGHILCLLDSLWCVRPAPSWSHLNLSSAANMQRHLGVAAGRKTSTYCRAAILQANRHRGIKQRFHEVLKLHARQRGAGTNMNTRTVEQVILGITPQAHLIRNAEYRLITVSRAPQQRQPLPGG